MRRQESTRQKLASPDIDLNEERSLPRDEVYRRFYRGAGILFVLAASIHTLVLNENQHSFPGRFYWRHG